MHCILKTLSQLRKEPENIKKPTLNWNNVWALATLGHTMGGSLYIPMSTGTDEYRALFRNIPLT